MNKKKSPQVIITLTTDFGFKDPYVGQMKGVLLSACRTAKIVDITHATPAWDVVSAAITIRTSYRYFAPPAVHLIVVDPEVGTQRALLAAYGNGHFFVAPDNGIFSALLADNKIEKVHLVEHLSFFDKTISPTFHGRDLMAPVAGLLAQGIPLEDLGPELSLDEIFRVNTMPGVSSDGIIHGQVQYVDYFGNIRTNIYLQANRIAFENMESIEVAEARISKLSRTYSDVLIGDLLALADSSGYLEIAANRGNAAEMLGGVRPGDVVTLRLKV